MANQIGDWDGQYARYGAFVARRDEGTRRGLPFAGAELKHLSMFGSPKRTVLRGSLGDGRIFELAVSAGRAHVSAIGGMAIETTGVDDVKHVLSYRPLPGERLIVIEAGVVHPGSDEEWSSDLAGYLAPELWGPSVGAVTEVRFELRSEPI